VTAALDIITSRLFPWLILSFRKQNPYRLRLSPIRTTALGPQTAQSVDEALPSHGHRRVPAGVSSAPVCWAPQPSPSPLYAAAPHQNTRNGPVGNKRRASTIF